MNSPAVDSGLGVVVRVEEGVHVEEGEWHYYRCTTCYSKLITPCIKNVIIHMHKLYKYMHKNKQTIL